jgi:CRP/FNR family transcriptional regulator
MRLQSGDIIFREGDDSDVAYLIEQGKVEIFRTDANGERHTLAVLEAGQMFGEMGPMDGTPRNASARALGETRLREMDIDLEDE